MSAKPSLWKRIFRLSDGPAVQDENKASERVFVHLQDVGSSGSRNFSGYAQEEYLQGLRGRLRADVFDQMRRSDPQVKMCLSAVKNPIKSATWEIEPADDTPEAQQDAELIEHILLDDMDRPWSKFLSEALTMCEFGHSVHEVVHKVVQNHPKFGSYIGIKKLAFRSQRTIERWNIDRSGEGNGLESISQYAYGDGQKVVDIDARFLLLFSLEQEGDNFEGISLLRPCYGNFIRKDLYLKLNAIGIEKFAIPTPVVKVPTGKENSDEYRNLITALENYTSHESAYLTVPQGWEVSLEKSAYDPEKTEYAIEGEDKRMVKAFLANFLELGMSGGGAYALSNDLSDFFLSGLDHVANELAHPINQVLIPQMVKLNRGPRQSYPTLKHSGISDKAGEELAKVVKFLVDSKVIIPDNQLEDNMRKRFGMPKASLEGQRNVEPKGADATQPGPVGGSPLPAGTLAERIRLAHSKESAARRGR